eukprot:scaffold94473_cov22-Prasinocladus_malaysianus.AAC.1
MTHDDSTYATSTNQIRTVIDDNDCHQVDVHAILLIDSVDNDKSYSSHPIATLWTQSPVRRIASSDNTNLPTYMTV